MPALPGLRRTDHVGLTVPDLDEAVAFFIDLLGAEELYRIGPFRSDDDWMAEHLDVHPRACIHRLAMLRCPQGPDLELFEYSAPDQRRERPRNSDVGASHLAFRVDDVEAARADLERRGLAVQGAPTTMKDGPSVGLTWLYFQAPWGLQLELVSIPNGRAIDRG